MASVTRNKISAWEIGSQEKVQILPAPVSRDWMDETSARGAYRCLPLAVANQTGWVITAPERVTARWNGGLHTKDVRLWFRKGVQESRIGSHFGYGVLTFTIPFLFRTPPGVNLWIKGPANYIKDGIQPLEGIVETDWLNATFTMNWKFTRPDNSVRFEEGEPICMIVPVPRGLAESLVPHRAPLSDNEELCEQYQQWRDSRNEFNAALHGQGIDAKRKAWQRDYMLGRNTDGEVFDDHQTRLNLRPFQSGPASDKS